MDLAELRRTQVISSDLSSAGGIQPTLAPLSDVIGLQHEHIVGQTFGGMQPHSRHEHVKWPNAVLIHHDSGIQVLCSVQASLLLFLLLLLPHVLE